MKKKLKKFKRKNKMEDKNEYHEFFKENCIKRINNSNAKIINEICDQVTDLVFFEKTWVTLAGNGIGMNNVIKNYLDNFFSDDVKVWQFVDIKKAIVIIKKNDLFKHVVGLTVEEKDIKETFHVEMIDDVQVKAYAYEKEESVQKHVNSLRFNLLKQIESKLNKKQSSDLRELASDLKKTKKMLNKRYKPFKQEVVNKDLLMSLKKHFNLEKFGTDFIFVLFMHPGDLYHAFYPRLEGETKNNVIKKLKKTIGFIKKEIKRLVES